MNKLGLLIRLEIQKLFRMKNSSSLLISLGKGILSLILTLYVGALVILLYFMPSLMAEEENVSLGMDFAPFHLFFVSLIALLIGFFTLKPVFFSKADEDTLWVLPIKRSTIFLAKFLSFYLTYLLTLLVMSVPSLIALGLASTPLGGLVHGLTSLAYGLGGLSLGLLLRLGLLIILPQRKSLPHLKSLISLILAAIFIPLYSFSVFKGFSNVISPLKGIIDSSRLLGLSIRIIESPLLVLPALALVLILTYLAIRAIEASFLPLKEKIRPVTSAQVIDPLKDIKTRPSFISLVRKDLALTWSHSQILIASLLSSILVLVGCLATLLPQANEMFRLALETQDLFEPSALIFMVLLFMAGIMTASSYSLSMEGASAYVTYTLPISGRTIMLAKLVASLVPTLPLLLISIIVLCLSLRPEAAYIPLIFVGPLVYLVLSNLLALLLDYRYASYDWKDLHDLTKNSKQSVFGGTISSFILVCIFSLVGRLLWASPWASCLLLTLLLLITLFLMLVLTKDIRLYQE